jgi:hypothetical protein
MITLGFKFLGTLNQDSIHADISQRASIGKGLSASKPRLRLNAPPRKSQIRELRKEAAGPAASGNGTHRAADQEQLQGIAKESLQRKA